MTWINVLGGSLVILCFLGSFAIGAGAALSETRKEKQAAKFLMFLLFAVLILGLNMVRG
jgi:hypothetical protein